MDFQYHWIDVNPYLERQEQPVYLIERPLPPHAAGRAHGTTYSKAEVAREGKWWVPHSNLNEAEIAWGLIQTGQYVRVPVVAYKTETRALAAIWGAGIELGMRAAESLQRQCREPIESCKLVLGHECHDLKDGFRCYVGIAFKMKE